MAVPSTPVAARSATLIQRPPRTLDGCTQPCSVFLPKLLSNITPEIHWTVAELADCYASPLAPRLLQHSAPELDRLQIAEDTTNGHDPIDKAPRHVVSPDESNPSIHRQLWDRLSELDMCIELLKDMFDAYDADAERDELSTASEVLHAIDEQLTRISELGVLATPRTTPSRSATKSANSATGHAGPGSCTVLQAVQSRTLRGEGWLRQCIFDSGLGVSGLLEAVHGELTDWQQLPTAASLREWHSWDQRYQALVDRSDAQQKAALSLASEGGPLLKTGCRDPLKGEIRWQHTETRRPLVLEACLSSMPSCKLFSFDMGRKMP
mmetsp:Transcript_107645/g.213906  ORF Transcript_107645/g.213906 Transcript_107645/m.213906 type:complete len:323 (+) Transcript_107645:67-1035(+)